MNTPRTTEQLWEELVEEAGEEEIAAADAMSVADAEAYLTANGFDVKAERAKAAAFLDELARPKEKDAGAPQAKAAVGAAKGSTPPAKASRQKERPGRRMSPAVLLAAAAVATAGGAAIYAALHEKGGRDEAVPEPSSPVPAPVREQDLVAARDLRARARAAMGEGQPDVCLKLLDQAKAKDPAGDQAPDVAALRTQANDAMVVPPLPRQGPK